MTHFLNEGATRAQVENYMGMSVMVRHASCTIQAVGGHHRSLCAIIFEEIQLPEKKTGLSMEQHREFGHALKEIREQLLEMGINISNSYPKGTAESTSILNVVNSLDRARHRLDDAMFREHGDRGDVSAYYGQEEPRHEPPLEP